jgi:two-component system phosphate regulon sensor histidine kinase PhoR
VTRAIPLLVVLAAWALLEARRRRRDRRLADEIGRSLASLASNIHPARRVLLAPSPPFVQLVSRVNDAVSSLESRLARLESDGQFLRTVLSAMEEGVLAIDSRRRLAFANPRAQTLLDLTPDAVRRRVLELIRSPQLQTAVEAAFSLPNGRYHAEISLPDPARRAQDEPLILAVRATSLPGQPPTGAILVLQDVTETRRLERVRQDFVANASHELKTPLAAIKAHTETLLAGALHDPNVNVRFLQSIDTQSDRLNQLIQDLLALARLEEANDSFDHSPLPLVPTVERLAESHRERAEAAHLAFSFHFHPDTRDAVVLADEEALRHIVDNLVDNAIKYTPPEGRVSVAVHPATTGRVAIEVADTGIGIPRSDQPRIFERFYRVDKARSRELGGTGLGLSIVRHLVQSLGGDVRVASAPGAGSRFVVTLNLASPDSDDHPALPAPNA